MTRMTTSTFGQLSAWLLLHFFVLVKLLGKLGLYNPISLNSPEDLFASLQMGTPCCISLLQKLISFAREPPFHLRHATIQPVLSLH
jgi:hypothetical protein